VIRWEYTTVAQTNRPDWNVATLNDLGREGWELIHVGQHIYTLKRPLCEAATRRGDS
jgi:hypothetical protein